MEEERVARLLEEIRDLGRQQVEAYGRVVANQQEALRLQREGLGRGRKLLGAVGLIIAVILIIVLVILRYVVRHYV